MQRPAAYIGLILITILMIVGKNTLLDNLSPTLDEVTEQIKTGQTAVLDQNVTSEDVMQALTAADYIKDIDDRKVAAEWVAANSKDGLVNLGQLNQPSNRLPAEEAMKGGQGYRVRVEKDYEKLRLTDTVREIYKSGKPIPSEVKVGDGGGEVTVKVVTPSKSKSTFARLFGRISGNNAKPEEGVVVIAREHKYIQDEGDGRKNNKDKVEEQVIAYAMTDKDGVARFDLPKDRFYSFVPVRQGFQYGMAQGTRGQGLGNSLNLKFNQQPHTIKVFDSETYSNIKEDNVLVVRTPEQFRKQLNNGIILFIVAWWIFFIYISVRDFRRNQTTDYLLPVLIMALTGIGLLTMFAMSNPLTDKLSGAEMSQGVIIAIIAMAAMSEVNFVNVYNGDTKFQKFLGKTFGRDFAIVKGYGYLALAVLFIILLSVAGTGPEGSDAKVNLSIGISFQPSEVCKYLIVLFLACFFARNATLIHSFAAKVHSYSLKRQMQIVGVVLGVILLLALMYMKLLSDMGPALVVVVTFIILYSVARKDLWQLLLGFATFLGVIGLGYWVCKDSPVHVLWFVLLWFVAWIGVWLIVKRRIYESAIFMNVVVTAFLFGGHIIGGSEGQRLLNRSELVGDGVWDNEVKGGDQIANGVWSLATGGLDGQGLGRGNANLVPAFNTDMVFTGIGEIMGFVALMLIIVCFAVLIHRCLLIGRKNGHPFAFFLVAGIALVIGVQFAVIVCGSLGLIPLTGVSVPFLSFGQSSLIINMAFIGIIVGLSRGTATEHQRKEIQKYDSAIVAGVVMFAIIAVVIAVRLLNFQAFNRDEYLIKPAMMTNLTGERFIEYNPRIRLLMKRLESGNIYDRNGNVLAKNERGKRVYPYGDHTLFILGDVNNQTIWSYNEVNPFGLVVENRYLSELRGFDNLKYDEKGNVVKVSLNSDRRQVSPYMPTEKYTSSPIALRDYGDPRLLAMLKAGGTGPLVDQWNAERHNRDMKLTLDAELQKSLQERMDNYFKTNFGNYRGLRASVVVLNASNGDLLTSANYPMPSSDTIAAYNEAENYRVVSTYEGKPNGKAVTERDLGLTFATPPGSTAKIISALAGLRRFDTGMLEKNYPVYGYQTVEGNAAEPNLNNLDKRLHTDGLVHLDEAVKFSSNCYFIKLVHENDLYPELESIYRYVGARVDYLDESGKKGGYTPYFFELSDTVDIEGKFADIMNSHRKIGNEKYDTYNRTIVAKLDKYAPRVKGKGDTRMAAYQMAMPWGQGGLNATPLNMARVAAIVANGGKLQPTRYITQIGENALPLQSPISVVSPKAASILKSDMQLEADRHAGILPRNANPQNRIAGKTGTPERYAKNMPESKSFKNPGKSNDAWYICFIQSDSQRAPLAIAVRIERSRGLTSSEAVKFVGNAVIPELIKAGYLAPSSGI